MGTPNNATRHKMMLSARNDIVRGIKLTAITLLSIGVIYVVIANITRSIEEAKLNSITPAVISKITITNKDDLQAGSVMKYKVDYCRYVDSSIETDVIISLKSKSNPRLVDTPLRIARTNNDKRCSKPEDPPLEIVIPIETIPGEYKLSICGYYHIIVGKSPKAICRESDIITISGASKNSMAIKAIQDDLNTLRATLNMPVYNVLQDMDEAPVVSPVEDTKPVNWTYKVKSTNGKQLGVYNIAKNAINKYKLSGKDAIIFDTAGNNITNKLLEEYK